jgi:hypothetical protein
VVDVEQRALRALEQDALAGAALLVEQQPDGLAERQDAFGNRGQFLEDGLDREFRLAQPAAQRVVMGEQPVDLGRQRLEIGEIHHPDRPAADLVLVGRADAAPRGADLGAGIGRRVLAQRIELAVQRQDQRGVVGNPQIVGIDDDALCGQPVDLADQRMRVDHHAIADDGELARPHDARGQSDSL